MRNVASESLKSSRSMDSLLLHYDNIVLGKEADVEERKERRKRISVSIGKRLLREVLDTAAVQL